MIALPARGVLLVTDEQGEGLMLALDSLLARYRHVHEYAGPFWIEVQLVLKPRPLEVRTAMLTDLARSTVDLVVWPSRLAEVGEGMRAFIERAQQREAGSISYGVITVVSPPLASRPIYRSDFYGVVTE